MNKVLVPTITQMADFGTTETFVARISLGLNDLLNGLNISEKEKKQANNHIFETFQELSHAFIALRDIDEFGSGKRRLLLVNQQKAYQDFYNYCWSAYKDRMPKILDAIGINIGFLFQKEKQFESGAEQFKQKYPEIGDEFIRMVSNDRDTWQNTVSKIRNQYVQHKKSKTPTNEKMKHYFNPKTSQLIFDNCWQAIEDIVVLCFTKKVVPGMKIGLIPEKDIDGKCPKKFCFYTS